MNYMPDAPACQRGDGQGGKGGGVRLWPGGDRGENARLRVLEALYAVQAEQAAARPAACGPGCHACCGERVQLTTLEGRRLAAHLRAAGRDDLLARLADLGLSRGGVVPRPAATTNALARLCLAQAEPPVEPPAPPAGACPLLVDGLCAAYAARPLACRTMASLTPCAPGGQASQDSWWVTLDTVFFQLAEQADAGGGFGFLGPVMAALAKAEAGGADQGAAAGLALCEDAPGFIAPPEHQARLKALLWSLHHRLVEGRPLGDWLAELRRG